MTDQMPFSPKLACLPIALVAFSMAFGAHSVHAQSDTNAPSWREIAIDPIMNAVHGIEQRLAGIEATVTLLAGSFTTQQLNTRQLCISDENGAQTCITKAQLDALLAKMSHTAAAEPPAAVIETPAEIAEARAVVTETYVSPLAEPATVDGDATNSAALDNAAGETAIANEPPIERSVSKTPSEATVLTAPEAAANDGINGDQEPATTGSVTSEPSHDAPALHPEVEFSSSDTTSSNECIPYMNRRLIWTCRSP